MPAAAAVYTKLSTSEAQPLIKKKGNIYSSINQEMEMCGVLS
jgi:hypothetical protein